MWLFSVSFGKAPLSLLVWVPPITFTRMFEPRRNIHLNVRANVRATAQHTSECPHERNYVVTWPEYRPELMGGTRTTLSGASYLPWNPRSVAFLLTR